MSVDRLLLGPWFCQISIAGRLMARAVGPCVIPCTGWERVSIMLAPHSGSWSEAVVTLRRTLDPAIGVEHDFTPAITIGAGGGAVYDLDCAGLGHIVPVVTTAESTESVAALYALLSRRSPCLSHT